MKPKRVVGALSTRTEGIDLLDARNNYRVTQRRKRAPKKQKKPR